MVKIYYFKFLIGNILDEIGTFDFDEVDVSLLTGKIRTLNSQLSMDDDENKEIIEYNAGKILFKI